VGTGLLAILVLAGSAGYAVAELFGWPSTLEANFPQAVGFYTIVLAATVIGFAMGFLPLNPIQLLVWTAVINVRDRADNGDDDAYCDKQNRNGPLPGPSRSC
jgi:Mn2+/Fe2+ NRAMP family transporter